MKRRIFCFVLALTMVFVGACSNGNDAASAGGQAGGEKEYRMLYSSEYSMNYLKNWWPTGLDLIVDGLVEFDKYGVIVPSMAEEWSKSDDGLVYTFKLREGQKWYTHDGKEYAEVTADDFIASAKYLLNSENSAMTANLIYDFVVNAEEYFDGTITDFSQVGIKAKDKYTVEYTLKAPCTFFLKLTGNNSYFPANEQFLEEAGEKFGTTADTLLYNGAYMITTWQPEDKIIYSLNDKYWNKENMHIDKFSMTFNKDSSIAGELFQRGDIDQAYMPAELMQEWVNDTEDKGKWAIRNFYRPSSWFWAINFNPRYEGNGVEDFKIAVNNLNFRKSLFHAMDRVAITETLEMWTPQDKVINTIVPKNIMSAGGKDYTQIGALKEISDTDPFDVNKAIEYKQEAMNELKGKVEFPIKLVVPYNTGSKDSVNAVQVFEQQMENALGSDYIEVILEPYPSTNFSTKVYDTGIYSIINHFWGADYADPASFTDIFNPEISVSKKYGHPFLAEGYEESNGKHKYLNLLEAALSENTNAELRYEKFAEAEAFLINEAMVIPTYVGDGIWWLCKLDPHEGNCNQFGRSVSMMKGKIIMDEPMTRDEYLKAEEEYLKAKEEALKNAKNQE